MFILASDQHDFYSKKTESVNPVFHKINFDILKSILTAISIFVLIETSFVCYFFFKKEVFSNLQNIENYLINNRYYEINKKQNLGQSIIQWQMYHMLLENEKSDVLVLGDSSSLIGIIPDIIEQKLKLKTWNLGSLGYMATPGYKYMLEIYIKRHGPPKFVILNMTDVSFTRDNTHFIYWLDKMRDWLKPVEIILDQKQNSLSTIITRSNLPSLYFKNNIKSFILHKSSAVYPEWMEKYRFEEAPLVTEDYIKKTLKENNGYLSRYDVDWDYPTKKRDVLGEPHDYNIKGLISFLNFSEKYNIKVILSMTPIPENSNTEKTIITIKKIDDIVNGLIGQYKNVVWIGPTFFPVEYHASVHHLNEKGAKKFTNIILKKMRK